MCSESRNLFNVWDNFSLAVQHDKSQLQWKTNRKLYVAYRMKPLPMPLNDLD